MTRDALVADAERRGEARGLVAGRAEVVARVERLVADWEGWNPGHGSYLQAARQIRLTLRDLTDPGDALADEQGA